VLAVILQRQVAGHSPGTVGQAAAFGATFWWATPFTVVALVAAVALPRSTATPRDVEPGAPTTATPAKMGR
jgi:hypothetical protein